ncbi:redoxin domain-containing protein [Sulfurovum sp. XGS-02]|uniref:redoxin domain-containing protein n=1 Tax=Sulfurovum sp. XGS-02 TaxID=2925411 RepID=UPI002049429C|nr:redoxin domain-containing protein [Sulfurovum sp. XGS-02]UPT78168.1 redoxin domain-containing protein [Sulfurovum sp. XGS-02]
MQKFNLKIKKLFQEIVLALLIIFVVSNIISYIRKPALPSEEIPTIELKTIHGQSVDMASYSGKPLIIHIWATWCPTCRMENSNIEQISSKYNVLTIAVKSGSNEKLQKYMTENKFSFLVVNDSNGDLASKLNIEVFPTTLIYDSEHKLKFIETGYTTTAGLLARMAYLNNVD